MPDLNLNYNFGPDLKEVPEDPEQMSKGYGGVLELIEKEEDDVKKASLEAKAAILARILGKLEDSENLFMEAIKTLKAYDMGKQATDLRTRLAVTHLFQGKVDEANKIFDQIIEKAVIKPKDENLAKLKEICLVAQAQHKFWNNQYPGTVRCLKEAAELKMNRGDTKGYNQMNEAITVAQAKIDEATGGAETQSAPDNYIDPLLALDATEPEED